MGSLGDRIAALYPTIAREPKAGWLVYHVAQLIHQEIEGKRLGKQRARDVRENYYDLADTLVCSLDDLGAIKDE